MSEENASREPNEERQAKRKSARQDYLVSWGWVGFMAALAPISYGCAWYLGKRPELAEQLYGENIYPVLGKSLSAMTGWLGFAFMDLFIAFVVIWPLWLLIRALPAFFSGRRSLGNLVIRGVGRTLCWVGALVFCFHLFWGFNYQRPSVMEKLELSEAVDGLKDTQSDLEAYGHLLDQSLQAANADRQRLGENDAPLSIEERSELFKRAEELFSEWAEESEDAQKMGLASGTFSTPKTSFLSPVMAKLGTSGMYFPYTGESIVSSEAPDCRVPFIALHEIAHQRGITGEDDANFIAWLICMQVGDGDRIFRYSANLEMMRQTRSALNLIAHQQGKGIESPAFKIIMEFSQAEGEGKEARYPWRDSLLEGGVRADLADLRAYFERNKGKIAETGRKMNNAYLKANGEEDGVRSYNHVVRLILAHRVKSRKTLP